MATRAAKAEAEAAALADRMLSEMVDDPMAVVRDLMAGAGMEDSEAWFNVYEVTENGKGVDAFLFKCLPEDFDQEKIGRDYGSGLYRLRVYVKDADHPNGVLRTAPKFAIKMPPGYKPPELSGNAPATVQAGLGRAEIVELLDDRLERVLSRVIPQTPVDPFANVEKLATLVKLMMPAPIAPVVPAAPPTLMEQLTMLKLVKEFVGDSGGGDDDGMGKTLLREGVGLVGEMVKTAQAQQAARPALPGPQPAAHAVAVNLIDDAEDEMKLVMRLALNRAVRAAAAGDDAEDFADKWYEEIPDEILLQLRDDSEWFARLCEVNADCGQHVEWFGELRRVFLEWFAEESEVDKTGELEHAPASMNGDSVSPANDSGAHGDSGIASGGKPGPAP